jgi:hypothetical protein
MAIIHCIPVTVYRNPKWDSTNGGISGRFIELLVACPDGHRSFDSDVETPMNFCLVNKRRLFGADVYDVRPAAVDESGAVVPRGSWFMFGGNFAHTSDSRFSDLFPGVYGALAIHDRVERE